MTAKQCPRVSGYLLLFFALIVVGITLTLSRLPASPYAPTSSVANGPAVVAQQKLRQLNRKLPVRFEANRGQTAPEVRFMARGSGYNLFLTPTEAVLALYEHKMTQATPPAGVRLRLAHANPVPRVSGLDELPGISNYFLGNDPKEWRTSVPSFGKVRYEGVYPGVDLVYYGNHGQLEYDFVIAPGTDADVIRMNVRGVGNIHTDAAGDVILCAEEGEVRMHKPLVYQRGVTATERVDGRYILREKQRGEYEIGFQIAGYDTTRALIIDPTLDYSTFLGGFDTDRVNDITVDSDGSAYVTGFTWSANFPTAPGGFQTGFGGGSFHAFVTKLAPDGGSLVYSTFLGGSSTDTGTSIAVDSSGNAYVTGATTSTNFPTKDPLQPALAGFSDAFVTKLNPTGSMLVYSTYLGGSGIDNGTGIAVDADGAAYITGDTTSDNFPTQNPIQPMFGGIRDVFVAKLDPTGSALAYSTYLGGSNEEFGGRIAVDGLGNAYTTGTTLSGNFPTRNPLQQFLSGPGDAFVTKLNSDGTALVFSTFLGGSGFENGQGIAVDTDGNTYITGDTTSTDFPTTSGAFQIAFGGGGEDGYVAKLNCDGSALVYASYLGGGGGDSATRIAVDAHFVASVTGSSASFDFPVTPDAPQGTFAGGPFLGDAFMVQVSTDGSTLLFATYLGGSQDDQGTSIAVDAVGNVYVAGFTASTDFPTTPAAFQTTYRGGSQDGFVAKFSFLDRSTQP